LKAVYIKEETVLSYLIVVAAAVLFFAVCYWFISRSHAEETAASAAAPVPSIKKAGKIDKNQEEDASPARKTVSEATQVFTSPLSRISDEEDGGEEKTRIFTKSELEHTGSVPAADKKLPGEEEPEPVILEDKNDPAVLETYFVRHFLNQYGAVSKTVARDAGAVTHRAVEKMQITSGREACDILSHIMVQEALQNAQRTYVMMPTDVIMEVVTDAFYDVAMGGRSETRTLLAYDALKAMPRMEENQFKALALLLLFHYSRNTDNVDSESFRGYAEKYVAPFLQHLPDEYSGYQQMEYLHCLSLNNKDMTFGKVMRDSYPLIFSFRGCMKSELKELLHPCGEEVLVHSLFNSYYKIPVVDDSLLNRFFDEFRIDDSRQREMITALLHSRPVEYDRVEMAHILGKISPVLENVQELWDSSLLRRSALTLMGMYIGQIYIREVIGEEFDLSHWM
jgi:cell division septum initiation protein DivIVA